MAEGMVEVVKIIKSGKYSRIKQNIKDGKQYFQMHKKIRDIIEMSIKKQLKN
jgi:hypothetical protein